MSQSNLEKIIARAEKVKDDYSHIGDNFYEDEFWLADTVISLAKALEKIRALDSDPYNHNKDASKCAICFARDALAEAAKFERGES